jgi:hypothetical protein
MLVIYRSIPDKPRKEKPKEDKEEKPKFDRELRNKSKAYADSWKMIV